MGPEGIAAMAGGEVHVAAITVWEILRKVGLGKLPLPAPRSARGKYPDWLAEKGYQLFPIGWEDAALAATLPDHHKDPMDRFLIAAALRRDWPIITADGIFRAYGVRTVW